jgi:formylglycine-generating enzyme required for sulfatase activity/uncharacterized protein YjbI with pentapeptide repeats
MGGSFVNNVSSSGTAPIQPIYNPSLPNHTIDLNASVSLEMIWVEPGTFTMGSPLTEAGRQADREDEHNVSLTRGFYLGKYEVTQAQYEAVMTGNTDYLSAKPSNWPNNPNRPVEKVSWDDVQIFLTRLNASEEAAGRLPTGWSYVLPTESQWEYACRAGTTTAYSWGNSITSANANYSSNIGQTSNVGYYAANPWGFLDMHGNVWEWTADWYNASYPIGNPVIDPTGPSSGSFRVKRGGAWNDGTSNLRAARRSSMTTPSNRDYGLGFRLAFRQVTQQEIDLNATAQNIYAYEEKPAGTAIGVFVTNAPDRGVYNTYSLLSNYPDESNFSIRGNILYSADVFDFETKPAYEIGVQVVSPDGYSTTTHTMNIRVAKDYSNRHMQLKALAKDLRGVNLSGASFTWDSYFDSSNLTDANLSRGNFSGLKFQSTNLTGADLTDANLSRAWFNSSTIWPEGFDFLNSGAWGPGVDFSNRYWQLKALGKDLSGANLSGTSFTWDSYFDYSNLTDANLSRGNFSGLKFQSTNLTGADLTDANLSRAWFNSSTIWPEGFDFLNSGAWGPGVDFSNRYWQLKALGKDLSGANLSGTSFTWDSKFESTNLQNANLRNGNFRNLNFKWTNLAGAFLEGADFNGATFNGGTNLTGAVYSTSTTWPVGFDPVAAGAILVNNPPFDLNSTAPLVIAENQPIGSTVGEFNATDPEGGAITYGLVSGIGDTHNNSFILDQNGTLRTATVFDYESGSTLSILVEARDEYNASVEGNFTVTLIDVYEDTDGDSFRDSLEASTGSDLSDPNSTPLQQGLVAWYPFDGNASDMSGNGNHGTVNGATLGVDRHGQANRAYSFDGVDDWVSVSDSHYLDIGPYDSLTISLWFSSNSTSRQMIFNKVDSTLVNGREPSVFLDLNSVHSGLAKFVLQDKSALQSNVSFNEHSLSLNSWHSLVVKLDRAKSLVSMTLDNVNYSETSEARSYSSQYSYSTSTVEFLGDLSLDGDLIFGARSNTMDLKFSGSIDDIRIYDRALSAEEIRLLYEMEAELPEQSVTSAKIISGTE